MSRYQGWFAFVLALAIAAGMFLVRTPLQLGLDLRGGSQLTVELRPAGDITVFLSVDRPDAVVVIRYERI